VECASQEPRNTPNTAVEPPSSWQPEDGPHSHTTLSPGLTPLPTGSLQDQTWVLGSLWANVRFYSNPSGIANLL